MLTSPEIAGRIKDTAREKNISVKKLLEDVGLGFNTMSNMKTSMPRVDNLSKIADYLNVSVDYLLGNTDIKKSPSSNAEDELIKKYYLLNENGKAKANSYIDDLLGNSAYRVDKKEDTVRVWRAARSLNHTPPGYSEMTKEELERLRNAPAVESDDEL